MVLNTNDKDVKLEDKEFFNNKVENAQTEFQGLVIKKSHNIEVVQTEAQGLVLVQASLKAAIEAVIVVLGKDDTDVKNLEKISQSIENYQIQQQSIHIEESDGIKVTQTELQFETVVQAVVKLLTQLVVRVR
jgi:spore coat protein X